MDLRRTPARRTLVFGLTVAAAGILTQFLTGVPGFPAIPPGPIILIVVAAAVVLVRSRWIAILGLLAAAFITVGMIVAGTDGRLTDPTPLGWFLGTWAQVIGLVIALLAGVTALIQGSRRPTPGA